MNSLTEKEQSDLIEKCVAAKEFSYAPYSKFRVGCAILSKEGDTYFTGCNVENVSYGLTICAERTAYTKAVSEGCRSFKAVAVCTDVVGTFVTPCGACRQFMSEFGDVEILIVNNNKEFKTTSLKELLPMSFDDKALENGQKNYKS